MEKASARKGLVKELRAFARQTGVAQVRDDSSRTKVEAMFQSIIASAAADVKTEATKVFEKYQSSFTAELESPVVQSANAEPFRLRGRSFLFTYNWDFFNKAFIDGAPKASVRHVATCAPVRTMGPDTMLQLSVGAGDTTVRVSGCPILIL